MTEWDEFLLLHPEVWHFGGWYDLALFVAAARERVRDPDLLRQISELVEDFFED